MNTLVRLATAADLPHLRDVELSAAELFAGTHMAWAMGEATDPARLAAGAARGDLWVAAIDGDIVGFLLAEPGDEGFYIAELCVARPAQGRGVGRALTAAALDAARARGIAAAILTTDRALPWNAPFYARLCFRTLRAARTPPKLRARLLAQPSPRRRCAMRLWL